MKLKGREKSTNIEDRREARVEFNTRLSPIPLSLDTRLKMFIRDSVISARNHTKTNDWNQFKK